LQRHGLGTGGAARAAPRDPAVGLRLSRSEERGRRSSTGLGNSAAAASSSPGALVVRIVAHNEGGSHERRRSRPARKNPPKREGSRGRPSCCCRGTHPLGHKRLGGRWSVRRPTIPTTGTPSPWSDVGPSITEIHSACCGTTRAVRPDSLIYWPLASSRHEGAMTGVRLSPGTRDVRLRKGGVQRPDQYWVLVAGCSQPVHDHGPAALRVLGHDIMSAEWQVDWLCDG